MRQFTPPTRSEAMGDSLWSRISVQVGVSVLRVDGTFQAVNFPTAGELAGLVWGQDFFLGGYVFVVSDDLALELETAGFATVPLPDNPGGPVTPPNPTDPPEFGLGSFGDGIYGA